MYIGVIGTTNQSSIKRNVSGKVVERLNQISKISADRAAGPQDGKGLGADKVPFVSRNFAAQFLRTVAAVTTS